MFTFVFLSMSRMAFEPAHPGYLKRRVGEQKPAIEELFAVSGTGSQRHGNQENSAKIDVSVVCSIVEETTPAKFYESLASDMMSDGFILRFNVLEYAGDDEV